MSGEAVGSVSGGGEAIANKLSAMLPRAAGRSAQVLAAFRQVDRRQFIDGSMRPHADLDCALPIGHAQTTSQPYIIARMLEMLFRNKVPESVLEVGAGCGYQTALLSLLCNRVVAIERIGALAKDTTARLQKLGYRARIIHGDGMKGYDKDAPYDGIVVCAAHADKPQQLLSQLADDGVLVMPLIMKEQCRLVSMNAAGDILARRERVDFVPMLEGKN